MSESASPQRRPGGRSARVVAAVHAATFDLLIDAGYEQLQLSDVAARADVNKTTVYRRWPTKVALVADLIANLTRETVEIPDTGTMQGDLARLLEEVAAVLANPAVRAVLYSALISNDPEVAAAQTEFWSQRFRLGGVIVERGIARGEVDVATDPRELLEMAAGTVYFRTLFADGAVGDDFFATVARRTIGAFAAAVRR